MQPIAWPIETCIASRLREHRLSARSRGRAVHAFGSADRQFIASKPWHLPISFRSEIHADPAILVHSQPLPRLYLANIHPSFVYSFLPLAFPGLNLLSLHSIPARIQPSTASRSLRGIRDACNPKSSRMRSALHSHARTCSPRTPVRDRSWRARAWSVETIGVRSEIRERQRLAMRPPGLATSYPDHAAAVAYVYADKMNAYILCKAATP